MRITVLCRRCVWSLFNRSSIAYIEHALPSRTEPSPQPASLLLDSRSSCRRRLKCALAKQLIPESFAAEQCHSRASDCRKMEDRCADAAALQREAHPHGSYWSMLTELVETTTCTRPACLVV